MLSCDIDGPLIDVFGNIGRAIVQAIVIGGGIGGLAAALALKRIGVQTRVFEQAPEIREVGAGLSLWSNAVRALERLGVDQAVIRHGSVYRYGRTITQQGALLAQTDFAAICPDVPCVMAHRGDLQQALLAAVGAEQVTTAARCRGVSQTGDRVQATFENGEAATADFLVGADGIHSVVRAQMFGAQEPRYSGFTCWRAIAEFEPDGLAKDTTELILGPGFQMGIFHCGPGRIYWFFALAAAQGGEDDAAGPRQFLLKRFGDCDPLLTETIAATQDACIFRNDLIDRPPAWPWGQGRITLLGDAIHSTTPNLGQGACQAIEDAVFLADSLLRRPQIEPALRHYEQRRRRRTARVTRQSWQGGRMLGLSNPLMISLRNALIHSPLGKRQVRKQFSELLNHDLPVLSASPYCSASTSE